MRLVTTLAALACYCLISVSCVNVVALAGGSKIGGPMNVDGPLRVQGDLIIGGPATVHGPVQARSLTVGGPVVTTFPRGEAPGSAGQAYASSLTIGGPLTVQGPLIVDGSLIVGGPLRCEPAQETSGESLQQEQAPPVAQGDIQQGEPAQQGRSAPRQDWTE